MDPQKTVRRMIRAWKRSISAKHPAKLRARVRSIAPKFLVVVGAIALVFPPVFRAATAPRPNAENAPRTQSIVDTPTGSFGPITIDTTLLTETLHQETPARIIIPSVSIDLPIREAPVSDGYWQVSETTASYGLGSGYPGHNGNTVIFAHARKGLFLPLRDIRTNARIYVLTSNRWYRYRASGITMVSPDHVQTIRQTKDERLTLFTCSGFLDSKRLVVTAVPDL